MFFEDEEEKAEREALVKGIAAFFDSLNNHLTAQKCIFICALIDSFLLGAAFFFPRYIYNLSFEPVSYTHLTLPTN